MTVDELEKALGPADDAWRTAVADDEREAFPATLVDRLIALRFLDQFIPRADGGQLDDFVRAAGLMRAVSRRDLTAAIALGQCFLGSMPVWLAGTPAQRARLTGLLRDGHLAALALTEREHGSDLLSTGTTAVDGALTGTKWLINNATRGRALSVFARTSNDGGLNGFSLFLFDKDAATGRYRELPKIRTHGIRGADISGVTLDGAPATVIGTEGSGLELTLRALQVTRIGCAAFSLGAADTALRIAVDFARERALYGQPVWNIPHARHTLTTAFIDLTIAEAVSLAGWRGLQVLPEQMSVTSAVVKYFVPTRCEQLVRDVAVVLGARHYLRDEYAHGIFQKMLRDSAVVSLFDGSTAVNLDGIGLQLPRLRRQPVDTQKLAQLFDARAPLPAFDGARLQLMNGGVDDVLSAVPDGTPLAERLAHDAAALAALDRAALKRSPQLFHLAHRYTQHVAAACCMHLARHTAGLPDGWLDAALHRLFDGAPRDESAMSQLLLERHAAGTLSLLPYRSE